jgi:ribose 5-phosphate isomerase B
MVIAIGSDHGGFELKQCLVTVLRKQGHTVIDCGTDTTAAVDYPDYVPDVCRNVLSKEAERGIVICGTGIGVSISANKIHGIRAALCSTEYMARMARLHNDANVLALGGRVIGDQQAIAIADTFLGESFSGEERHKRRIAKMMDLEKPR